MPKVIEKKKKSWMIDVESGKAANRMEGLGQSQVVLS
jgi:hypothetical protein